MQPPIFVASTLSPAVTALLGTDPTRFYPFGEAPSGTALPYAVWQVISGSPENYLAGRPDMDGWTLQIDVYADTGSSASDAARAIRDAIELKAHIVRWGQQERDRETNRFRISFDVEWLDPR